ncbi:MAG: purine-binding chemotaxis protein CheW [Deltaproteobacteria bacterium]|nr:purine-binding chemotaxis protein CheW [Deltaproteobacteria bacterium]MBI3388475.1 purine-binding chemotaxis protein CheW [Deltaproteobacteria bacterium]
MNVQEPPATAPRQHLTFTLAEQTYGIDILNVQEIKGWAALTAIPNTPPFLKGVMNLRGTIIPVIDLRVKFGLPAIAPTRYAVIIVATVGTRTTGLLVDGVSDVLDFRATEMQPPPDLGGYVDVRFIRGVACVEDQVITLLDISCLVGDDLAAMDRPPAQIARAV